MQSTSAATSPCSFVCVCFFTRGDKPVKRSNVKKGLEFLRFDQTFSAPAPVVAGRSDRGRWPISRDVPVKVELHLPIVRTRHRRVPQLRGLNLCCAILSGWELERDHAIVEIWSRCSFCGCTITSQNSQRRFRLLGAKSVPLFPAPCNGRFACHAGPALVEGICFTSATVGVQSTFDLSTVPTSFVSRRTGLRWLAT